MQKSRCRLVAGIDEVGRGPLAGPVVAAAVILPEPCLIEGLADSKRLSETRRNILDQQIRRDAVAFAIAEASVEEIDSLNILHASLLAMQRAAVQLSPQPDCALIDGNRCPQLPFPASAIVKGDQSEACISAASILAKVYRDALMCDLHLQYPEFGFNKHKGYPTKQHLSALLEHGALPVHRRSFSPVGAILEEFCA